MPINIQHQYHIIEVDGMPRHILDIRPVVEFDLNDEVIGNGGNDEGVERRYPQRYRKDPVWMKDYDV